MHRKTREAPEDNGYRQDNGSGASQEHFGPVIKPQSQRAERWTPIRQHLENEGVVLAFQNGGFEHVRCRKGRQKSET